MNTSGSTLSSLTKLQKIRCSNEGMIKEMIQEVATAVLEVIDKVPVSQGIL